MPDPKRRSIEIDAACDQFASTCWTTVLEAGRRSSPNSREALETLCRVYWYPLYAYVRRSGYDVHAAEDLTQEFFSRLLEKDVIAVADPNRGRFRSFLLTVLRNFLSNQRDKSRARKRGGTTVPLSVDASYGESRYSLDPAHGLTPERVYEREWARTLLDHVVLLLQEELARSGKERQFEQLAPFLAGRTATVSYADAAGKLGISEAAAMKAASRLRIRFRELLRSEIAETVASPEDVEDEIRHLFDCVGD